jgi:Protein of unknown function (DUF2281)
MTRPAETPSIDSAEIPEHVLRALKILSPEQRQQAFAFIEFLSQTQPPTSQPQPTTPKKPRVFGQYAGRITMSADFDDPLPDSFWLGES